MLTSLQYHKAPGVYFWDPLTSAVATDESLVSFVQKRVTVVEEQGAEIGRIKVGDSGTDVRVAMTVDAERFIETYLATLNGQKQLTLDWEAARALPPNALVVTVNEGRCTLEGQPLVKPGEVMIQLMNKSPSRMALIAACTYDEGKTKEDAMAAVGVDPPEWVHVLGAVDANSMSAGELTLEVTEGPFFIACFDGTPGIGPDKKLSILGPVEVAP